MILDFPGDGVWLWQNNSQWLQLHTFNAARIAMGNLDGAGKAAILADFPGYGIWVWRYGLGWSQLHSLSPNLRAAGDLDGTGQEEVLIDFPEWESGLDE